MTEILLKSIWLEDRWFHFQKHSSIQVKKKKKKKKGFTTILYTSTQDKHFHKITLF